MSPATGKSCTGRRPPATGKSCPGRHPVRQRNRGWLSGSCIEYVKKVPKGCSPFSRILLPKAGSRRISRSSGREKHAAVFEINRRKSEPQKAVGVVRSEGIGSSVEWSEWADPKSNLGSSPSSLVILAKVSPMIGDIPDNVVTCPPLSRDRFSTGGRSCCHDTKEVDGTMVLVNPISEGLSPFSLNCDPVRDGGTAAGPSGSVLCGVEQVNCSNHHIEMVKRFAKEKTPSEAHNPILTPLIQPEVTLTSIDPLLAPSCNTPVETKNNGTIREECPASDQKESKEDGTNDASIRYIDSTISKTNKKGIEERRVDPVGRQAAANLDTSGQVDRNLEVKVVNSVTFDMKGTNDENIRNKDVVNMIATLINSTPPPGSNQQFPLPKMVLLLRQSVKEMWANTIVLGKMFLTPYHMLIIEMVGQMESQNLRIVKT